jgi:hypothetical protein
MKNNSLKKVKPFSEMLKAEHYGSGVIKEELKQERMYTKEDMNQFAFECVTNFLSNDDNKVEIKLIEVIINRNNLIFEKFKNK